MLTEIEGEKIFFLPYFIDTENVKRIMDKVPANSLTHSPLSISPSLLDSPNKNEKLS